MENRIGQSAQILSDEREKFEKARENATDVANNGGLKTFARSVSIGKEEFYVVDDGATVMVVPANHIS
jgi:hypothetical protein